MKYPTGVPEGFVTCVAEGSIVGITHVHTTRIFL